MEQRVSLITLGVADVARAAAFYERLGWRRAPQSQAEIAFFQLAGQALALYQRTAMAEDMGCPVEGAGSVALAQNLRSREEVERAFEQAVTAGGKALRTPYETPWGGYIAYVADPDGHPWEFAHVPAFPLSPDGTLTLPGAADPAD